MKLFKRGGIAAIAIAGAAAIAAGCGGSGDGASGAAKDSAALDFVPKDAIGYVTVDTDFSGENWEQFSELATAFDPDFKGIDAMIAEEAKDGEDGVDWEKDVDPWLGESAGAAVLGMKQDDEGDPTELFAWAELEDRAKFEEFAKDEGMKEGDEIGDFATLENAEDETFIGYNDELAVLAMSRKQLEATLEYDGDSITDAEGVSDAIDEAGDDALATIVISGEGLRSAVGDSEELKSLRDLQQLDDFRAAALSLAAEDDGMRLSGFVGAEGEDESENIEHSVFNDLPGNTVLAIGGGDFGGSLQKLLQDAGKENAQIQQGVGAAEAAIGLELEDLAKAMDGEFVLAMAAEDEGLGALAGGVAGAAMGGGVDNLDPSSIVRSSSILLAFEETGDTSETLDKLVGAVGGFAGATGAPKTGTAGDFETKEMMVAGMPLTTASSDDVAALLVGQDVFETWGDESLADNETFSAAWDAAEGPDKSAAMMWLDVKRIATLAGVEGSEERELGGMVGWAEADGTNAKFGAFLHVPEA